MSVYTRKGYSNRKEYLQALAEDYGLPFDTVLMTAESLGPEEDFDGLVSELEDLSFSGAYI
jgi:hypothetical protein